MIENTHKTPKKLNTWKSSISLLCITQLNRPRQKIPIFSSFFPTQSVEFKDFMYKENYPKLTLDGSALKPKASSHY